MADNEDQNIIVEGLVSEGASKQLVIGLIDTELANLERRRVSGRHQHVLAAGDIAIGALLGFTLGVCGLAAVLFFFRRPNAWRGALIGFVFQLMVAVFYHIATGPR